MAVGPSDPSDRSDKSDRSDRLAAEELRRHLESASGRHVEVKLTCNLRRFVSFRVDPQGRVKARVQEAFLDAPEAVLEALGRWMGKGRGRCPEMVREFIRSAPVREVEPRPVRAAELRTAGCFHDLAVVYARVNREFFAGAVTAPISWGRLARPGRRVCHRRLGAYNRRRGLITINPALDQAGVPEFFVAFVVYHEMLHALQPAGTRRWHDREFHDAERRHPHWRRAREWERRNLSLLMRPLRGQSRHPAAAPQPFQTTLF
jgi:hypothetical protein